MRWEGNRQLDNVEDRRGTGSGRPVLGGRSIGIGSIVVALVGGWANHAQQARQILELGDAEKAMNAAAKIGDDALQRSRGDAVVPESFAHGTSAQPQRWFNAGLQQGKLQSCDTFSARTL